MSNNPLAKGPRKAVGIDLGTTFSAIVRSVKRGFMWKGRVVRAEEVIIKKWKEGFLVALAGASSQK